MAELERELESARRESQDRVAKVTGAQAAELLAVERVTTVERGLEAEIEVALQKSLANTEAALQSSLETMETERKALESERKAQSEAD